MSRHDVNKSIFTDIRKNLDSYAFTGLVSESLGIGTESDKLTSFNDFSFKTILPTEARRLYANSDILQNIVDIPALDATREGFTISSEYDSEGASEMIMDRLDELDAQSVLRHHLENVDLYERGSMILPILAETKFPGKIEMQPHDRLSINTIQRIEGVNVLSEDDFAFTFNAIDPFKYSYMKPLGTFIRGVPIHESRYVWNTYKFFPRENRGVSLLHKILLACLALRVTNWSLATVMLEIQNKILKVENLDAYAEQDSSTPDFRNGITNKRAGVIDTIRRWMTSSKMLVIDKNDNYERQMYNAQGVKDATEFFWEYLSAVSGRPQAVIKGQAMGTISSSDTDAKRYAQSVKTEKQIKICKPIIKYLIQLLKYEQRGAFYRKFGLQAGEIKFDIEFNQIWEPDEKEQADIELSKSQMYKNYFDMGVLASDQIRKEAFPELAEEILPTIPENESGDDIVENQEFENQQLENA